MTTAMSTSAAVNVTTKAFVFVPIQSLQSFHISVATNVIIAVGMFGIGLTSDLRNIWYYLKRPKAYLIGILLQLIFVPLFAWTLTKIFVMNNIQALGVMIQGCSPGGTISNVVVYWVDGVVDLSVAMTSTTTVLALGTMPLWLLIFEKGNNLSSDLKIPFRDLGITLASFLGPLLVGMIFSWIFRNKKETLKKIAKVIIALASIAILVLLVVTSIIRPIRWILTWKQGVVVAIMQPLIYVVGHGISAIPALKLSQKVRRTVGIEVAFQNVQVCAAVLTTTFLATQPRVYGQLILFPLLYYIFQVSYGVVYALVLWLGRRNGCLKPEDDEGQELRENPNDGENIDEDGGKKNPAFENENKL